MLQPVVFRLFGKNCFVGHSQSNFYDSVPSVQNFLSDEMPVGSLADDAQFLQRALECYQSDIEKAENTGHEYFIKLLGDLPAAKKDTPNITQAIDKISQFSV